MNLNQRQTGVESMVAPVLLSEIASNKTRGAITSLHQLNVSAAGGVSRVCRGLNICLYETAHYSDPPIHSHTTTPITDALQITLGILISNLIGYGFVPSVPHGWKYVQAFVILPAVLQVGG